MKLVEIADRLSRNVGRLRFDSPVAYVYNPLRYARAPFMKYIERYGHLQREIVLVGMNPGPWGMAQTGIPFGEVRIARDWLGVEAEVGKPRHEHPKRPITGFACPRSEVSGSRLWGWARDTFGKPDRFFRRFFVMNYCPLCFIEDTGRNRTPDKLPARERDPLFAACDRALRESIIHLQPRHVVGIGVFAESRARAALHDLDVRIGRILHPSPASPAANCDWAGRVKTDLEALGITVP